MINLVLALSLAHSFGGGFQTPTAYFEAPEASALAQSVTAGCGRVNFSINIDYMGPPKGSDRSVVRSFRFGTRELSRQDYKKLADWMAGLRGSLNLRVMCNVSGVDLVMVESFLRDKDPPRRIEITYVAGQLRLVESWTEAASRR